jgi:hypothetical protein
MRLLRPLGKLLAAGLGLFLVVGLLLPRGWGVERSVLVAANPAQLTPLVLDVDAWPGWAPPGERRGEGAVTSTGAVRGVALEEGLGPDALPARVSVTLAPAPGGTVVRWVEEGELPLLGGYFRDWMEARRGAELEAALRRLQALAEAR